MQQTSSSYDEYVSCFCFLLEGAKIISATAIRIQPIPATEERVSVSLNFQTPTITEVSGSMAPKAEVSVEPILRTATTIARLEMTVGMSANRKMLPHDAASGRGETFPSMYRI